MDADPSLIVPLLALLRVKVKEFAFSLNTSLSLTVIFTDLVVSPGSKVITPELASKALLLEISLLVA